MPDIHATAIVAPAADIADDVVIGPYCVIDGPVTIGAGCELIGHVHLRGCVSLGVSNRVYPFTCVGFEPQDMKFDGTTAGVAIGDHNVLREAVTIHCSSQAQRPTTIGSHNMLMANSHAAHDVTIGDHCTIVQGAVLGGHAVVEDQVILGGNAAVHQFCRVGRLAMVGGGGSAITMDVPPFVLARGFNVAYGMNVVGLRRSGLPRDAITTVRSAYRVLFRSGLSRPSAIAKLREMIAADEPGSDLLNEMITFIEASKRGIVAAKG